MNELIFLNASRLSATCSAFDTYRRYTAILALDNENKGQVTSKASILLSPSGGR